MRGSPDRPGLNLTYRGAGGEGLPVHREPDAAKPARHAMPWAWARQRAPQLGGACLALALLTLLAWRFSAGGAPDGHDARAPGRLLVSYSYFEKDTVQRANAEFFWKAGIGVNSRTPPPEDTDFVVVVQGSQCGPCEQLRPLLRADPLAQRFPDSLSGAWSGDGLAMLWRTENEGMDFAAHNVTLEWVRAKRQAGRYRWFLFLNSSVRGPFAPSYMPPGWRWPHAFTQRLAGDVKGVASSLVCLPAVDAGGPGPRMESWAFALDAEGLAAATAAGVFRLRACKLCAGEEGIVVGGEYGLSQALLGAGYNIATLMSRYARDVDWRERRHWGCNGNAHPSRHGTYDGLSHHPYETVFLKASWHVGEPHLSRYTRWALAHAQGDPGTEGSFDEAMYRYAISEKAQEARDVEACFRVLPE